MRGITANVIINRASALIGSNRFDIDMSVKSTFPRLPHTNDYWAAGKTNRYFAAHYLDFTGSDSTRFKLTLNPGSASCHGINYSNTLFAKSFHSIDCAAYSLTVCATILMLETKLWLQVLIAGLVLMQFDPLTVETWEEITVAAPALCMSRAVGAITRPQRWQPPRGDADTVKAASETLTNYHLYFTFFAVTHNCSHGRDLVQTSQTGRPQLSNPFYGTTEIYSLKDLIKIQICIFIWSNKRILNNEYTVI